VRQAFLGDRDKRFTAITHRFHSAAGAMLNGFRGFSTITQQRRANVFSDKAAVALTVAQLREARVRSSRSATFPKDTISSCI